MGCWYCEFFYVKTKEEPCNKCLNKCNFKLWENDYMKIKKRYF